MSMPTILPTGQLHPDLFAVVEDMQNRNGVHCQRPL